MLTFADLSERSIDTIGILVFVVLLLMLTFAFLSAIVDLCEFGKKDASSNPRLNRISNHRNRRRLETLDTQASFTDRTDRRTAAATN